MVRASTPAFKHALFPHEIGRKAPESGPSCGNLRLALPSRGSIVLSLRNAYEALAVSAPTVVAAARGRLTAKDCDAHLERFAAHVMRNAEISVTVRGREVLEADEKASGKRRTFVVMSNHQSHYDIPVLYYVLGGNMRMVAKKELFSLPLFGRAIRDAGMIEVDRKNRERAIASLSKAKEQLHGGTNIWIAPEGTRSTTGALGDFKKGGFVIAIDMDAPILPITIDGTRSILPSGTAFSKRGQAVDVTIHAPIETHDFMAKANTAEAKKTARTALMEAVRKSIASAL